MFNIKSTRLSSYLFLIAVSILTVNGMDAQPPNLHDLLSSRTSSLKHLNGNGWLTIDGGTVENAIDQLRAAGPGLVGLNISDVNISGQPMTEICTLIEKCRGLTYLNLLRVGLSKVQDTIPLSGVLRQCTQLELLALMGNSFNSGSIVPLIEPMGRLNGLRELFLNGTPLCAPDIATNLALLLGQVPKLERLGLGGIQLNDFSAIRTLSAPLTKMTGLYFLDLTGNNFSGEAASAVAAMLWSMKGLTQLMLIKCRLDVGGFEEIYAAFSSQKVSGYVMVVLNPNLDGLNPKMYPLAVFPPGQGNGSL